MRPRPLRNSHQFHRHCKRVFQFDLAGLAEPKNLDVIRRLFTDPDSLRPGVTSQSVTEQVAEQFGRLSDGMRLRGVPAQEAAHFLMKLMFCMFAEDIDLLHGKLFSRSLAGCKKDSQRLTNADYKTKVPILVLA